MITKYFKKGLAGLLLLSLCYGCDLTENLTGQPTPDKFFQQLSDFESFIMGAYSPITVLYASDGPYVAHGGAEDIATSVVRWKPLNLGNFNEIGNPDEITSELWNPYYSSVSSCNTLLQLIEANTHFSEEELAPIKGEALFIRAFDYFNLVRRFGEVPVLTELNQTNAVHEPQGSIAAVYEQIVKDLQDAEKMLPASQPNASRPTAMSATALLAKVYLTMAGYPLNEISCYAQARDKALEVINANQYTLEKDFFDLWLYKYRYTNTEYIFALYGNTEISTGGYLQRAVRPWDGGEEGWGDFTSDKRFLAMFDPADKRIKGTFYLTMRDGSSWEETSEGQPYLSKFRDGGERSGGYFGPPTMNNANGFYPMIRYADILLVYAEAANLAEGSPSAKAYWAINEVRKRAGLPDLAGLSSQNFDKAVLDERNFELAFECNRWFDLYRRHILKETLEAFEPTAKIDDHNYLLPKPIEQLTIMLGLKQNPGYE